MRLPEGGTDGGSEEGSGGREVVPDAVPTGDDPLEGEALGAERGLQVRQPYRLGVPLGEERPVHELRVTALDEVQDEDLFPGDLGDTVDADLAGRRGHRGPADRAAEAGD